MNKKYFLLLNLISSMLITSLAVVAQPGGGKSSITNIIPTPIGIAPITWIIFGTVLLIIGYGIYWIFSSKKKSF